MTRLSISVLATLMALPLVACEKNQNKGTRAVISTARGGTGASGYTTSPSPGQMVTSSTVQAKNNGRIGAIWRGRNNYWSQDQFQNFASEFVTATMPKDQLGTVSGEYNDGLTGIRFWGFVQSTQGAINPNFTVNATVDSASSRLFIWIFHSFIGQRDASGKLITEYAVELNGSAQGTIQGNVVNLTFSDQYGTIALNGTFNAQNFSGVVFFDNKTTVYNDGRTAANYLGEFDIETCSFFRCQ